MSISGFAFLHGGEWQEKIQKNIRYKLLFYDRINLYTVVRLQPGIISSFLLLYTIRMNMISITMMFSLSLEMFFVITMFHTTHLISNAFIPVVMPTNMKSWTIVQQNPEHQRFIKSSTLYMATSAEDKAAIQVTGEALEMMLQEWDQPLVVDAYATW